ncbi:unnamed protein product [Blepharisma stoltei]|uniref:CS domain-containing protein n=1 Tax=Blepharisma stoltei TaxID=1481888 RepID=A0AAU9KEC6_9CILI|nr:unnamed protein product [Blepharisma stoltei]
MKLYAHYRENTYTVILEPHRSVGYLAGLIAGLTSNCSIWISKFPSGQEISENIAISSFFDENDDVWVVRSEESKAPISVGNKPKEALEYLSLSQYSFYESGKMWVKVDVPFEGIGAHPKELISHEFGERYFGFSIRNFKGKNYKFFVPKLQCKINPEKSKIAIMSGSIRVSLYKDKENDNWFSLFKAKTIGGDDD